MNGETEPLWREAAPAPRPSLAADAEVEVAVVGAGIGGLATAWHLAERGILARVVEGRAVAAGASGRNGGFLIAGAAPMYNDARRRFGADLARRIQQATLDAQREVYATAAAIGADGAFRRLGMLRLAVDEREAEHVREHAAALAGDGFPGRIVEEPELPEPLRRSGRIGLATDHDAAVHPVRWLAALAGALEERGVRIHERTPVAAPRPLPGGGHELVTAGGPVLRAGAVVVASDAAIGTLAPSTGGRVRPRRLHMVATAPLGRPHVAQPVYARYGHEYHHQLPDGRIALGGFSDLDGEASYTTRETGSKRIFARLGAYLAEELGVEAPVTHRWVGLVGYTADERPLAGAVPGVPGLHVMGGYCGTGNLCAWVAGRIVAELVAEGRSRDADLFDPGRNGAGG